MSVRLIIFGYTGTVVNAPWVDKRPLHLLPGRREKAQELVAAGTPFSLVAQQGGVAFGKRTEQEATQEVATIAKELGADLFAVGFGHPSPAWGYDQYATDYHLRRRFPNPGLLEDVCKRAGVHPAEALLVTQQEDEIKAAIALSMPCALAVDFFAAPEELVSKVYTLFKMLIPLLPDFERDVVLKLEPDGSGEVGFVSSNIGYAARWSTMLEGVSELQRAIEELSTKGSDDEDDDAGATGTLTPIIDDLP